MKTTAADRSTIATAPLVWCGLALLLPRATLFGELSPFGIGLAACSVAGNLPTMLCLAIGYLLASPVTGAVRYVATVALIGGLRWVLAAFPDRDRHRFLPAVLAFVATAAAGVLILGETHAPTYALLAILAEGAVAAGAALVFEIAGDEQDSAPTRRAALYITGAIAVMAATTIAVETVSLGGVAAAFLVLVAGRAGREAGGSLAGGLLGGVMALSLPGQTPTAVILACGGLLAGALSRFGRWPQAGGLLLWAGIVTLFQPDATMLARLWEVGIACPLFALLPRGLDQKWCRALLPHQGNAVAEGVRRLTRLRLETACGAMDEVGRSVEEVSRRLLRHGAPDLAGLYRGCAETVCAGCPLRGLCWDTHAEEMQAGLEALTPLLRREGRVTPADLSGYPADQCRSKERLTDHINRGFQQWTAQESAWNRLKEIQQAVSLQFAGTGELLRGLCRRVSDPGVVDSDLSDQIATLCEDHGLTVVDALCTRDDHGRLTVDILTEGGGAPTGRWQAAVEEVCRRPLAPPVETAWGNRVRLTLTETPRYRVEWGQAQQVCATEKLCGDSLQVTPTEGGVLAVLADGMGCGGRAAVDSAMAAGITARLWGAGFCPEGVLQTVNAALLVKSREESLSTLDVAVIDTHTGRLDSYKAGAAVTLLRSGGRVSRLDNPGLPVGILPGVRFEHSQDHLAEGDLLLMVSDGALAAGVTPLEVLLRDFPEGGDLQALAETVCATARAAETHPDDISAVVLRLVKEG